MNMRYLPMKYGFPWATKYKNIGTNFMGPHTIIGEVQDAGWHFAKLGGVDRILTNLNGYPHQEMLKPYLRDRNKMAEKIRSGIAWDDLGENKHVIDKMPYDPSYYPEYVVQHPEIYEQYFDGGMK